MSLAFVRLTSGEHELPGRADSDKINAFVENVRGGLYSVAKQELQVPPSWNIPANVVSNVPSSVPLNVLSTIPPNIPSNIPSNVSSNVRSNFVLQKTLAFKDEHSVEASVRLTTAELYAALPESFRDTDDFCSSLTTRFYTYDIGIADGMSSVCASSCRVFHLTFLDEELTGAVACPTNVYTHVCNTCL